MMRIDHIEVFMPDRKAGIAWLQEVFGFVHVEAFSDWGIHPSSPYMMNRPGMDGMIAVFEGQRRNNLHHAGWDRVAFGVDAEEFLTFRERLKTLPVRADQGNLHRNLGRSFEPVDHHKAWSLYFRDPFGNRYEITTYDYEQVKARLEPA